MQDVAEGVAAQAEPDDVAVAQLLRDLNHVEAADCGKQLWG